MDLQPKLTPYILRLGDSNLIMGHRLSEMCSRAPFLEEDVALANLALDHIGQAEALLKYAGELEGQNRTEDDLAYLRPEWEFRNYLLTEQPNTDFAFVIARQYLVDVYQCIVYESLQKSSDDMLAGMATRFLKEAVYHHRHSSAWMIRLGKGTEESHSRIQRAVNELWKFTGELFQPIAGENDLVDAAFVPDSTVVHTKWTAEVSKTLSAAGLTIPDATAPHLYKSHTEHLGHLLVEMQFLQRAYPGAAW